MWVVLVIIFGTGGLAVGSIDECESNWVLVNLELFTKWRVYMKGERFALG